jgi:hypothetical protein
MYLCTIFSFMISFNFLFERRRYAANKSDFKDLYTRHPGSYQNIGKTEHQMFFFTGTYKFEKKL